MHKQKTGNHEFDLSDDCCQRIVGRRQFLTRAAALTIAGTSVLTMAKSLLPRSAEAQTGEANSIACILFNMTGHDVVTGGPGGVSKGGHWDNVKAGTPVPKDGKEIGKLRRGTADHHGWLYFVERYNGQETPYQLFLRITPSQGHGVLQARLGRFNGQSTPGNPMPSGIRGLVQVVNNKDGPVRFFLGDFGEHSSQTYWP